MSSVDTRLLQGFDDPTFGSMQWDELSSRAKSDIVYMTWHWQRAWWETFHRGRLLLIVAQRDGRAVALAPLYADEGMVFFASSQFESDYLDFIGDVSDPEILDAILSAARDLTPDFEGFRFYFVPERTGTGEWLKQAAERLGLDCYEEDQDPAPVLRVEAAPELALALANQKRLQKLERFFSREEQPRIHHLQDGDAVLAQLPEFFEQHVSRWSGTRNPSRFACEEVRRQFQRFTQLAAHTGWLRFTRIDWQSRPIAFHYGLCYRGRYFWGPASFAIDLARHSPGMILLRHLLLAAVREGVRALDFGTGAAPFKVDFSNHMEYVHTWGLYPREAPKTRIPLTEKLGAEETSDIASTVTIGHQDL